MLNGCWEARTAGKASGAALAVCFRRLDRTATVGQFRSDEIALRTGQSAEVARAQEPRDGEHVLAVRDGLEDVAFDPLAVEKHGGSSGRSSASCRSRRAGNRVHRHCIRCGQSRNVGRRRRERARALALRPRAAAGPPRATRLRAASRTATVGLRADCAGGKGRRAPMRCRLAHRLVFAASRNTFPSGRERAEGTTGRTDKRLGLVG